MVSVVVLAYCSNSEEKKMKCGKDKSYYNKALLIELSLYNSIPRVEIPILFYSPDI